MDWSDLSDDELHDRLSRRVQDWRARELVARRDDVVAADLIGYILEEG